MSNLRRFPLKPSTTNKWKSSTLTNDLPERKTRALEGSLNKLRLTMHRDKIKSTLEVYRPIASPRGKHLSFNANLCFVVNLFSNKSSIIKCGQCENNEAEMKCFECTELYCANCFAHFHLRGALQRHRYGLLSENRLSDSQKKSQTVSANNNLREFPQREDIHRKSTVIFEEKQNLAVFQQSFLEWRQTNKHSKSKQFGQKQIISTYQSLDSEIETSNKLPNIDLNSSKTSYDEKNDQEFPIQRSPRIDVTKQDQPKVDALVNMSQSFSDNTDLNEPSMEIEPFDGDLSIIQTEESTRPIAGEQERAITHVSTNSISRPNSSLITEGSISSRSNSVTPFQPALRSLLATKSSDELPAFVDSHLISSRPSSSSLEKTDQFPILWNRNWKPGESTSNINDMKPIVVDQYSINQFDLALNDLLDESKIELANLSTRSSENLLLITKIYDQPISARSEKDKYSTHASYVNSATTTPRRNSPFSFSNSLYKTNRINSSSSRDTGDGGFFTDVLPRQQIIPSPIPPPPILECSTSNEWKHAVENQATCSSAKQNRLTPTLIPLCKSPIENLLHETIEQIPHDSRPGSSLSSASLPISITSSKSDFINTKALSSTASTRRNTSTPTSTTESSKPKASLSAKPTSRKSSPAPTISKQPSLPISTTKDSSAIITTPKNTSPPISPIVAEDKKVIASSESDEHLQESMNSIKDKSLSSQHMTQSLNDSLKTSATTLITRDESIELNDLPTRKKTRRRRKIIIDDDLSGFRKLEFSFGDGLKWHEASTESMRSTETISTDRSSEVTTPRSNTKFAQQFSVYDNDDGCSSVTYQNVNDEECFNQLREELCSELRMTSSDEDAIINEHILKILQSTESSTIETDLTIVETKHREEI